MNFKKITLFVFAAVVAVSLAGCRATKIEPMDELNTEGKYHYQNSDLGFELYLPADFIYYQTQRKNDQNFSDLEIYVPTADMNQQTEVSGYAKPIVVRVFNKDFWNNSMNDEERGDYTKIGEKGARVYTIKFWDKIPADWAKKWTDDMKQGIIANFKMK
jgi:hypothetical protein